MEWPDFIEMIYEELRGGDAFDDFRHQIKNEQNLTEITALKLRSIFSEVYGLPYNSDLLINHVTFRKGPTEEDKKAYRKAKRNRWVFFHDVFYAPDILIQDLNSNTNILPIEVKLIKGEKQSPSQSIATAIGQALIYTTKYPHSIVFLGVLRSAQWGRYKFRTRPNEIESKFYNKLNNLNVRVLVREVGLDGERKA
jgi:hypothetical protein